MQPSLARGQGRVCGFTGTRPTFTKFYQEISTPILGGTLGLSPMVIQRQK